MAVKTATATNRKPSFFLLPHKHGLTKSELQRIDAKLLVAFQTLKDETCTRCGTVAWHGRTTDSRVQFKIESSTCFGCAKQEIDSNNKSIKPKPGENRYARVTQVEYLDGTVEPLPDRSDYLERLHQQHLRDEARKAERRNE